MSLFNSPFNISHGSWSNGPNTSLGGGMEYNTGRVSLSSAGYNAVSAPAGTLAQITVVNGRLARYYASAANTDVKLSGHSFYAEFQTRGVSVDESVAAFAYGGVRGVYYSNGIREGAFGPASGGDNSRIVIFGVSS